MELETILSAFHTLVTFNSISLSCTLNKSVVRVVTVGIDNL